MMALDDDDPSWRLWLFNAGVYESITSSVLLQPGKALRAKFPQNQLNHFPSRTGRKTEKTADKRTDTHEYRQVGIEN